VDNLSFFAVLHGLPIESDGEERFIRGRAGRIVDVWGDLTVEPSDVECFADDQTPEVGILPMFDPLDSVRSKLALEVVETLGQKKLATEERRKKFKLLEREC
jgi:hypothetical protein